MTKYKKYSKREEIWVCDAWLCLALTGNYYYCCLQSDKQKWDNGYIAQCKVPGTKLIKE